MGLHVATACVFLSRPAADAGWLQRLMARSPFQEAGKASEQLGSFEGTSLTRVEDFEHGVTVQGRPIFGRQGRHDMADVDTTILVTNQDTVAHVHRLNHRHGEPPVR